MELRSLWASVRFTAQNGSPEELLSAAAQRGLHLDHILPCPGGFMASCAAWQYRPLSAWLGIGGYGCTYKRGEGSFLSCVPCCAGAGCGWGLQYLSHCCFGHRDWYGPSIMKA